MTWDVAAGVIIGGTVFGFIRYGWIIVCLFDDLKGLERLDAGPRILVSRVAGWTLITLGVIEAFIVLSKASFN
jgi:hypothetical protein